MSQAAVGMLGCNTRKQTYPGNKVEAREDPNPQESQTTRRPCSSESVVKVWVKLRLVAIGMLASRRSAHFEEAARSGPKTRPKQNILVLEGQCVISFAVHDIQKSAMVTGDAMQNSVHIFGESKAKALRSDKASRSRYESQGR